MPRLIRCRSRNRARIADCMVGTRLCRRGACMSPRPRGGGGSETHILCAVYTVVC